MLLLTGALALTTSAGLPANAAAAAAAKQAKQALPDLADFKQLSGSRPRQCSVPIAGLAALGQPSLRQCAWSERVEMLYWDTVPAQPGACLTPAALAWNGLARSIVPSAAPVWDNAASGQALLSTATGTGLQQAASVWRKADGQWAAVLWRWLPSPNSATRAWQAAHWNTVAAAVRKHDAGLQAPATPLMQAWLAASKDKPRVLDGGAWRWLSDGACFSLQTSGITQARLHLPWSRDDARQEQRSAMQVLLARRFPNAEWLQPFTLLQPATQGARTGAKFIAVWREANVLQGRLWIPLPKDGGIVRAHLTTGAPTGSPERTQELTKQRAALIERELTALAHAWETLHE